MQCRSGPTHERNGANCPHPIHLSEESASAKSIVFDISLELNFAHLSVPWGTCRSSISNSVKSKDAMSLGTRPSRLCVVFCESRSFFTPHRLIVEKRMAETRRRAMWARKLWRRRNVDVSTCRLGRRRFILVFYLITEPHLVRSPKGMGATRYFRRTKDACSFEAASTSHLGANGPSHPGLLR